MKKNYKYMLLAAAVIVALGVVFYQNLDHTYEMQGDTAAVFENYYAGVAGYEIDFTNRIFTVTGEDPQVYLSGIPHNIGGIELTLAAPAQSDLPVQLFYLENGGESYSERQSVKSVIAAGESACMLPVPPARYDMLRFDIDGDFVLEEITTGTQSMKVTPVVSGKSIQKYSWYFPAVIICFLLIFWAHGVRAKGMDAKTYTRSIFFGAPDNGKREVYLDYFRILAAVLVILAHACSPMIEQAGDSAVKRLVLIMGLSIGLCCNLLYVMLSGTLLLSSKKEEKVSAFYVRRASKVIIPLIAYYLLLLSLNHEVSFLPPENLGAALKRILTGAPDAGPHLWLIYTIVALYLITPFFRVMVKHLNDRMLAALGIVILVMNILTTYLPVFGIAFGISTFLAGWEGVFLIGYIMTRDMSRKRDNQMIFMGILAFIVTVFVVYLDTDKMNYVYNNAPTMILMSCGIFAFFLKKKSWFSKTNAVVKLCSKYSYSVILIHWYALFVVVQGKFHITALRFGCIGGIVATVVLAFLTCLVMAVLYDNTVVIVLNVLFEKLTEIFGNIITKHKDHKMVSD